MAALVRRIELCFHVCTECKQVCGDQSRTWMPDEVRNGSIGEQLVWFAKQPVEGNLTCLNTKCKNYLA